MRTLTRFIISYHSWEDQKKLAVKRGMQPGAGNVPDYVEPWECFTRVGSYPGTKAGFKRAISRAKSLAACDALGEARVIEYLPDGRTVRYWNIRENMKLADITAPDIELNVVCRCGWPLTDEFEHGGELCK